MANIYIFDAHSLDQKQLTELLTLDDHHVVKFIPESLTSKNVPSDAEIISIFVSSVVSEEMLVAMPHLRLIACRSTGFDNVAMAAATERGIVVSNVPSYGDHTVAEYAFTLLLALVRKLPAELAETKAGDTSYENVIGNDLNGKTLGVIGAGRIGQRTLAIGRGFGMKLLAFDPYKNDNLAEQLEFTYAELDDLLKQADFISLHVPMTAANKHLIDAEKLALMKPGAIVINTARGELIDTQALIESLQSGHLGGAALDVLEGEKLLSVQESLALMRNERAPEEQLEHQLKIDILLKMPNVILTSHNAFNTAEAIYRINSTTADNIKNYLAGRSGNVVKAPSAENGTLYVVRHGESEWNALGVWTGSRDVHLSEKGFHEAALLGRAFADIKIDQAYTSQQIRALETLEGILGASQQFDVPFERSKALNERDYGQYTGKNKWQVRDMIGEEAFNHVRRDWDYPVPGGETLKMVSDRVVPFYQKKIVPKLTEGKTVLIVSHGNAIRSLMKHIEGVSDSGIAEIEMPIGNIIKYSIDNAGHLVEKDVVTIETTPSAA